MADHYLWLLFGFGILLIWVPWLTAHKIRPYFGKRALSRWLEQRQHKNTVVAGLDLVEELYKDINPHKTSKNYRRNKKMDSEELLYGEIYPVTLIKLLDYVEPQANDCFVDLGSGAGLAVLLADYCYPLERSVGIELLPPLYYIAQENRENYEKQLSIIDRESKVEFILGNFLEVDYSFANIVFINATAYQKDTWSQIQEKFKELKTGSRVIVTTLELSTEHFELVLATHEVMSWGFCSVRIYKRV